MNSIRQLLLKILPAAWLSVLRSCRRKYYGFQCGYRGWWPYLTLVSWLLFQCFRNRRRAVIICRCGALGDLVCTLPLCDEVRQRHPGRLLVFITAVEYRGLVRLSRSVDLIYANRSWIYPFTLPSQFKLFGLVEAIYNPQTTD